VPHILTALRVSLGVAWATLVASELIAAQRGLGAMIQNAATYFLLDVIYVGIICIGCVALLMDTILRRISARLLVCRKEPSHRGTAKENTPCIDDNFWRQRWA